MPTVSSQRTGSITRISPARGAKNFMNLIADEPYLLDRTNSRSTPMTAASPAGQSGGYDPLAILPAPLGKQYHSVHRRGESAARQAGLRRDLPAAAASATRCTPQSRRCATAPSVLLEIGYHVTTRTFRKQHRPHHEVRAVADGSCFGAACVSQRWRHGANRSGDRRRCPRRGGRRKSRTTAAADVLGACGTSSHRRPARLRRPLVRPHANQRNLPHLPMFRPFKSRGLSSEAEVTIVNSAIKNGPFSCAKQQEAETPPDESRHCSADAAAAFVVAAVVSSRYSHHWGCSRNLRRGEKAAPHYQRNHRKLGKWRAEALEEEVLTTGNAKEVENASMRSSSRSANCNEKTSIADECDREEKEALAASASPTVVNPRHQARVRDNSASPA